MRLDLLQQRGSFLLFFTKLRPSIFHLVLELLHMSRRCCFYLLGVWVVMCGVIFTSSVFLFSEANRILWPVNGWGNDPVFTCPFSRSFGKKCLAQILAPSRDLSVWMSRMAIHVSCFQSRGSRWNGPVALRQLLAAQYKVLTATAEQTMSAVPFCFCFFLLEGCSLGHKFKKAANRSCFKFVDMRQYTG